MIKCVWECLSLCPQNDSAYYYCIVWAVVALWCSFVNLSLNVIYQHFIKH